MPEIKNTGAGVEFLLPGTRTASGDVVQHDITRFGLGRLCIEQSERYPDVITWHEVVRAKRVHVLLYSYGERLTRAGMVGRLWIYYKVA